jgi:hypothetical protein
MTTEHCWNDSERRKPKYSEKKVSRCHFVHHRYRTFLPGIKKVCCFASWLSLLSFRLSSVPMFVAKIINVQKGHKFAVVNGAIYRGYLRSGKSEEHKKRPHNRIISLQNMFNPPDVAYCICYMCNLQFCRLVFWYVSYDSYKNSHYFPVKVQLIAATVISECVSYLEVPFRWNWGSNV